jgi:hypothetical protein
MTGIITYLSIITLNVTRVNFPIKGPRLVDWLKTRPNYTVTYKKCTSLVKTNTGLKLKGGKDILKNEAQK